MSMESNSKYLLIDNIYYLDFFLENLSKEYIPIALNDNTRVALKTKGIKSVGIFDYLTLKELKDATKKAFLVADILINVLDEENKDNYKMLFGRGDVKLVSSTMNYIFKRFTIATLRLLAGLEAILKNSNMQEIAYIHDGKPIDICPTKKERGFFFPDDITWSIITNWNIKGKPRIVLIKATRKKNLFHKKNSLKAFLNNMTKKSKIFLSPIKKRLLGWNKKNSNKYAKGKKNLLFLSPLYDLSHIVNSNRLSNFFNAIIWDPDVISKRDTLINLTKASLSFNTKLNLEASGFKEEHFFRDFKFKDTVKPLIEKYFDEKLQNILFYWYQALDIESRFGMHMVLWNNSPHRYPSGILKEFFRLLKKPICGMQHGGMNGSNDLEESIFSTDLDLCDFYLSYGFQKEDIKREPIETTILPVGSLTLKKFKEEYERSCLKQKKEFDIIFPVALTRGEFYFENEITHPRLFSIQKKIIDVMAEYKNNRKILIKFPPGKYDTHPLAIYIEHNYPGKFTVMNDISFTECLKKFKTDLIVLEELSTPLNEALITESNIIVFNDLNWFGLTKEAQKLLSKRAVLCNDEDTFAQKIKEYLKSGTDLRDCKNREFLERFCLYEGDPEANIENAIISLMEKKYFE